MQKGQQKIENKRKPVIMEERKWKYAVLLVQNVWSRPVQKLAKQLEAVGVHCVKKWTPEVREQKFTVVITDCEEAARSCSSQGYVCIGISDSDVFFSGAGFVITDLEAVDAQALQEYVLREWQVPVVVAQISRLVIRDIEEKDFERLREISRQESCRAAMHQDCFEPERLQAYIQHVYRWSGYGLWSVLKKDGTLIGCCGVEDWENDADVTVGMPGTDLFFLELQYMLDEAYQRRGYGREMCRAVLSYAFGRLNADAVCVRIKKENTASLRLAYSLGFLLQTEETDPLLLVLWAEAFRV